jgi:hypothetical protein
VIAAYFCVLDGVLVFRTPGGSAKNLPNGILAVDTWLGYTDIMIIKHTGKHPFSSVISRVVDGCS